MDKIFLNLWYANEAEEAAKLYASLFPDAKILWKRTLKNTPSGPDGNTDLVMLELPGFEVMLMNAGPLFKMNPSISLSIESNSEDEVRSIWEKLSPGGEVLMELKSYDFGALYGWIKDRFGMTWQVSLVGEEIIKQKVRPSLLFVGNMAGKAEEAINLYTSLFPNSAIKMISRYGASSPSDKPEYVNYASFTVGGKYISAMDSALPDHTFTFNEAISIVVNCEDQAEIDMYWDALSAVPQSEQCGWLKDKFGISWQIQPARMNEMMASNDEAAIARVTQAFLSMKKLILEDLEKAFRG